MIMWSGQAVIFETERLMVRAAVEDDADLFYALWTDPRVMRNVGFPCGLPVTQDELRKTLSGQRGSEFERLLVVQLKATGQIIGECKLSRPDSDAIAQPDVKLIPQFWGHKYGVEIWRRLVDYQFTHSDCSVVRATPNIENAASIKMQETVGLVCIGEAVHLFPEHMQSCTTPVHHYIYEVNRADWHKKQAAR